MPGRQADRFLQEGELWVIEAESLIDHMGLGLDADVQDGNGLATICHEGDLRRQMEEKRKPHFRSPEVPENMQGCAAELRAALLSSSPHPRNGRGAEAGGLRQPHQSVSGWAKHKHCHSWPMRDPQHCKGV